MGKLTVIKNGKEVVYISIHPLELGREKFLESLNLPELRAIGSSLNVTARTKKGLVKEILDAEDIDDSKEE